MTETFKQVERRLFKFVPMLNRDDWIELLGVAEKLVVDTELEIRPREPKPDNRNPFNNFPPGVVSGAWRERIIIDEIVPVPSIAPSPDQPTIVEPAMTPEERAAAMFSGHASVPLDGPTVMAKTADAIREAVLAEREACAETVIDFATNKVPETTVGLHMFKLDIAKAIRAREPGTGNA